MDQGSALEPEMSGLRLLSVDPSPTTTPMSAEGGMPSWLLPLRPLIFGSPAKAAERLYGAAFHIRAPSWAFLLKGKPHVVK